MVKKKLYRILCVFSVFLVLLVTLAPLLSVGSQAMTFEVDEEVSDGIFDVDIYHMLIPLDVLRSDSCGMQMENPMYSVAVYGATNLQTVVYLPDLDVESGEQDLPPFTTWTFGVTELQDINNGFCNTSFTVNMDSLPTENTFALTNSLPFVCDTAQIYSFLSEFRLSVPPGYTAKATVEISYQEPRLISEGGWQLVQEYDVQTFSVENLTGAVKSYDLISGYDVSSLITGDADLKHLLVDSFVLTIDLENKKDGLFDDGYSYSPGLLDFTFQYGAPAAFYDYEQFFDLYPAQRVFVSSSPDSNIFNLTVGLKTAVGGFFETEIIPGLSFGGLLAVVVGISLVVLYLKVFS